MIFRLWEIAVKKIYQKAFVQTQPEPSHAKGWLFFLLLSFLLGILYGNLFGEPDRSVSLLGQYSYQEVNYRALFFYCLKQRFFPVIFLYFLGISFIGNLCLLLFLFYTGFAVGAFLAIQIIGFGISGVLIGAGSLFPHYLIYLPVYWMMFRFAALTKPERYSGGRGRSILLYCVRLLLLLVLTAAGVCLESFVNPRILQAILRWAG